MSWQTILYFSSILLTFLLTGFLTWYAWRQPTLPGIRTFAWMVLSECLLALTEILSMLGGTQEQALFWFNARVIFIAVIPVLWLKFALEYNGRKDWLSKQVIAGAFIVPLITQAMLWSNSLHGLWVQREAAFQQNEIFWIAQTSARIPGIWFMVHSFYSLILLLAGIGVLLFTAWQKRDDYRGQAVLLSVGALISLVTTVIAVFNLLPQSEFNPFVPGIGISVLMYALAIFRFQFLKRTPTQENTSRLTVLEPHEKNSVAILVFIFILLASSIAAASYFTYQNYERQFRVQVENQLSAISALKADNLQDWRNERLADARLFYQNDNFSERVRKVLEDPQDAEARINLLTWMEKVQASPEYDRIFLLDVQGVERISIPAAPEAVPQNLVKQASASLESDQIIFLDFHRHSDSDAVHLSMVVPIFDAQNNHPLGVLVLRIDPNVHLYPFIQRWPVPSQSAETLLIRREGNDVLYLNQLKFEQDAALNLRIPMKNEDVPAVKAALGFEGIVTGVDYRGVQVIADLRAVPNSPWFLVSKVDSAEVDAPLRARLWQTLLFFGALILMTGAGLLLIWRQQRINYYRGKVEAAEALRSSEEKFRLAFDTSPDSVSITRMSDGMFVSVNKGFEQISGYTREHVLGKTSAEINIWKDPADRRNVVEALQATGKIQNYEAPFLALDGEIYGLMSAVIIELNGEPHILNIVRDITERKRAEKALYESEDRFRRLAENAQDLIYRYELSPKRGFSYVSPAAMSITGYSPEEHYADPDLGFKLVHPDDRQLLAMATQDGDTIRKPLVLRWIRKDGSMLWTEQRNVPVYAEDGTLVALEGIAIDITERKRAEAILHESETNLSALIENTDGSIWAVDQQYRLVVGNREFHRNISVALGRSLEMGESVLLPSFPPEVNAEWQGLYDRALQGERFTLETVTHFRKEPRYIEYYFSPIREDDGGIRGVTVYGRDITERRKSEKEIRFKDELLHMTSEMAKIGGWEFDALTQEGTWTDEVAHIHGLDPAQPTNVQFGTSFYLPDSRRKIEQSIQEAIEFARPYDLELQIVTTNGEQKWVRTMGLPILADGKVVKLQGIFQDITERKQTDEKLRESNSDLKQSQSVAHLGNWKWNLKTSSVEWSDEMFRIFGIDKDSYSGRLGDVIAKVIHPDDLHIVLPENASEFANNKPREYRIIRPNDGELRHIWALAGESILDEQGNPAFLTGIAQDITERKQAQEQLIISETRYRRLFEAARDGILIMEAETGIILDANPFLIEMLDFPLEGFIGKELWELGFFKDIAANRDNFLELQRKEYIRYENLPLETADGRKFQVEFVSNVYQVNHHKVIQCNIRDITERKRAEEQINEQLEELRRWHNATLGRESRVLELKCEVNHLLKQTGLPPRYPSAEQ